MSLEKLRKQIDVLDKQIVALLNRRANITLKIGDIKNKTGKSIYCPEREKEVFNKVSELNQGPLSKDALESIYREIMSASIALEKKIKVAFLGPQATFTHQAALKRFGSQVEYKSCENITDVFVEVEKDNVSYGVVPIENSTDGAVNHTLDMFVDSDLKICSEVILNITHNLMATCEKEDIKKIYSKGEVFGQCRIWLQNNMPGVDLIEVSSTSKAASMAAKEKGSACIASSLAGQIYGLKLLAKSIQDSAHNITRFFVIGKNQVGITGKDKTSLLMLVKDKVGALHDMLVPFKKYGINLNKIESRPFKRKAWEYYFFVDLEGHRDELKVKKTIEELELNCKFLKVLGSYPSADY